MATVGNLVVNLGLNSKKFSGGLNQARSGLSSFASGLSGLISKIGAVAVAGAALAGIGSFGGAVAFGVAAAAEAETAQVAFATIIGDAGKAKQTLADLSAFAAATPFETPELTNASRSLLAFGVGADELIPTLRAVGDVSSGIGAPIEEIAELYGKAKVQGRLFAQDINQLTGRGIPIIGELAKQFGVTENEVKGLVESGSVNFGHLQAAFASMSGEGGKFGGMMAAQSATLSGQWSTLKDNVGLALRDIGQAIIEEFDLKGALGGMNDFASNFRDSWMPTIRGVIHAVAETWTGTVILFRQAWQSWIGPAITDLSFFVNNWDLMWGIAQENVILFATNAGARIMTFFTNIGELMSWFAGNWQDVLATIGSLIFNATINYYKNFFNFFKAIFDFASGKGFKFEPTAMTDGFTNSIKEIPKLTKAAVKESTPELERLYTELGKREAEANKAGLQKVDAQKSPEKTLKDLIGDTPAAKAKGKKESKQELGALTRGSKEALSAIFAHRRGGTTEEKALKAAEDSAKSLINIETYLAEMNDQDPVEIVVDGGLG